MAMSLKDFGTLKGAMARTTSDNDPEALASIRVANRILAKNNLTWEDVFKKTVKVIAEVEEAPEDYGAAPRTTRPTDERGEEIDGWFQTLSSGRMSKFIEDLYDQWQTRRWLSPGQYVKLKEIIEERGNG